ncbi:Mariner Mos1 transposase [Eumeta japonica]|uniref:Mariner Mos1 transposase n=1 Tax=Eumeta variegata TaxID=151549 RepID=A0A4C1UA49_EUMVA|nr:Mariner Mos1 transposase [Eumeta japonica]
MARRCDSNTAQYERNRSFGHLVHALGRAAGGAKLPSAGLCLNASKAVASLALHICFMTSNAVFNIKGDDQPLVFVFTQEVRASVPPVCFVAVGRRATGRVIGDFQLRRNASPAFVHRVFPLLGEAMSHKRYENKKKQTESIYDKGKKIIMKDVEKDVVLSSCHILFVYMERLATLITYGSDVESSNTPSRIANKDPHVQTIQLAGPARRSERHVSWTKNVTGLHVVVWSSVSSDPVPWSPVAEDRANVHLYHINGSHMKLVSYLQLENETLSVKISKTQSNIVEVIEQIMVQKNGVYLDWATYETTNSNESVSKLSSVGEILQCNLPAPARVVHHSPNEIQLLVACIDGSLHIVHRISGLTHSVQAGFKPGHWVPYELKPKDGERRFLTCELVLQRQKRKCFLHRIVTGNEKWIHYNNSKHRKSWGKPGHASTSSAKPNIHGSKHLCIWWDQQHIASEVQWPGDILIASEERGRLQCYDRALAVLHNHEKCLDLAQHLSIIMSSKEGDLYHQLFLAYKGSHAELPAQLCQKNANEIWKMAKEKLKNKEKFIEHINDVIRELKVKTTKKKATMLNYFTQLPMKTSSTPATSKPNAPSTSRAIQQKQDSDIVASSTCSSLQSTAVKRKLSDTHDEQSQNTDEETVETPSTEPHTTLIDSGIARNVPSKPAQETLMKKIGLLQQRINILTEARDTGIAKDDVHNEIKKLRKELKEDEKSLKKKRLC